MNRTSNNRTNIPVLCSQNVTMKNSISHWHESKDLEFENKEIVHGHESTFLETETTKRCKKCADLLCSEDSQQHSTAKDDKPVIIESSNTITDTHIIASTHIDADVQDSAHIPANNVPDSASLDVIPDSSAHVQDCAHIDSANDAEDAIINNTEEGNNTNTTTKTVNMRSSTNYETEDIDIAEIENAMNNSQISGKMLPCWKKLFLSIIPFNNTTNNLPEPRNIEIVEEITEHTPIQDMDTEIESQETIPTTILDGATSNTETKNIQPNNSPALDASINLEDKKEDRLNSYRNIIQEALTMNKHTPNLHNAILKEIPDSFFGGYWNAMIVRMTAKIKGNTYALILWNTFEESLHSSYPEGPMAALAATAISIQFATRVMLNAKNKLLWEDSPDIFGDIYDSFIAFMKNQYDTTCQINMIESAIQIRTELWKFRRNNETFANESALNHNNCIWNNLELSYIALQEQLPKKSS